ncbi:aromatic acid exporter family protein [Alkalibacillus haloalkaliphilus]|uniref:aromatic acid exporter family protein n=1 Tax=Alkalibacillus haloalkaliphilus TaxID=94136 RepID=UPI002935D7AB|nr:aromatic acid exporter family protein [Alkalibacillus haloalkaliphilus]MDV2580925.1 aromatic acid exporter family protein [Alkalibacillus haloalkaliphilus]
MFKVGSRTIKTAIGAPVAIMIAQALQLDNAISAAILTILCIQVTRQRSLQTAWYRFYACMIGIAVAGLLFELIAYNPLVIGLILIVFIPITVKLGITEGIITSTVIILHLYGEGALSVSIVLNEIVLLTVGLGVALILNMYMPSLDSELEKIRDELEENFSKILREIANYLKTGEYYWSGHEITETARLIEEANELASRDVENHLLRRHHPFYHYFHMREKQFDILERMLPLISRVDATEDEYNYIGELFEELADHVHPGNTAVKYLEKLNQIRKKFNKEDLPDDRETFEQRANLYLLLNEIEQYLILKRSYKKSDI